MATQKGRNWSSGDIVTAANLSSIERGVSAVAEEYTPTTWANGDTVTAVALNNIEQGIVNASGGSSDFSTATVTGVSDSFSKGAKVTGSFIFEDVPGGAPPTLSCEVEIGGGDVVLFALYKGSATVRITSSYTISVSGNITDLEYDNLYEITGDCTITISGGQVVA